MKRHINYLLILAAVLLVFKNVLGQNPSIDFKKGGLFYQNPLASKEDVADWIMEGPGVTEFKEGWMHMYSPDEKFHHVYWCPKDFPGSFIAEWELQNQETDAGLCIVFFAAKGNTGEDIFDPSFPKRDGTFNQIQLLSYFLLREWQG
jgi:hypothetical protein